VKIVRMVWEMCRVSTNLLMEASRMKPTHLFVPDYLTVLRNAPALVSLRARGVKVIARLGNAPEHGTFYRLLWRYAVNPLVDLFVANSGFTCRELVAHGVLERKILTIPNTTTERRESWVAGGERIPGRVIFVGQIIPEKGLDLLLGAVAVLRGKGLNVTLDVVGDMDGWESPSYAGYRAGLRARARQADLAGAVEFLGWREDVPVLMARASVHCCPSRPEQREAFGNVVLEAKMSGVPSIVTPSGDLPELVAHAQDGWACAAPTVDALAEGIEFFITNPARLAAAGAAARRSASRYSNERFADAWSQVFAWRGIHASESL
jgi:glycosyltransferase involved in cell wall biosynthesis